MLENQPTTADFNRLDIIPFVTAYGMTVTPEEAERQLRRAYGDRVPGGAARWLDQNRPGWREATCSVEGCERPSRTRGWCRSHYEKWRRHGDPTWTPPPRPIPTPAEIAAEMTAALAARQAEVSR